MGKDKEGMMPSRQITADRAIESCLASASE